MLLLLMALCVPVISIALAAEEEEPLIVPVGNGTILNNADGKKIGVFENDANGSLFLKKSDKLRYQISQVVYDATTAETVTPTTPMVGMVLVSLIPVESDTTEDVPKEGWIDATLIVKAQASQHKNDIAQVQALQTQIVTLQSTTPQPTSTPTIEIPEPVSEPENKGIFSAEKIAVWVPVVALVFVMIGAGALVWRAISAATTKANSEKQTSHLEGIEKILTDGIGIKTPLTVEQTKWPDGHISVDLEPAEQFMEIVKAGGLVGGQYPAQMQQNVEPPPPPVREGEEPELLALANRLAGVGAAAEWRRIVEEAGWRAVQLKPNPTEKGTYVVDDSGYSAIACLTHGAEPKLGYVVPSFLDSTASEPILNEFYEIEENESVVKYRIDALALIHIDSGNFYLRRAPGRLTRRPRR